MTRWFEAHTIAAVRALPAGRADRRRRGRVRRHRPLEPPPVGLLAAVPADRRPAAGQAARRDRHARDRPRAVRGPPARRRAAGDGRRQAVVPNRVPIPTGGAGSRVSCPACTTRCSRAKPTVLPLTLYTDCVRDPAARSGPGSGADHRHPQPGRRGRSSSSSTPSIDEYGSRRPGRPRPTTPRSTSARSCSRWPTTTVEARPDLRTPKVPEQAMIIDPAVPDHRPDPPAARARPARGAQRADRPVPAGDRRDVLVGHGRRGPPDGADGRVQPQPGPDPGPAPRGRPVGRARPVGGAAADATGPSPARPGTPWAPAEVATTRTALGRRRRALRHRVRRAVPTRRCSSRSTPRAGRSSATRSGPSP